MFKIYILSRFFFWSFVYVLFFFVKIKGSVSRHARCHEDQSGRHHIRAGCCQSERAAEGALRDARQQARRSRLQGRLTNCLPHYQLLLVLAVYALLFDFSCSHLNTHLYACSV